MDEIIRRMEVGTELPIPELGISIRLDGHSKAKKIRVTIRKTPQRERRVQVKRLTRSTKKE